MKNLLNTWRLAFFSLLFILLFAGLANYVTRAAETSPSKDPYLDWLSTYLEESSGKQPALIKTTLPTYSLTGVWVAVKQRLITVEAEATKVTAEAKETNKEEKQAVVVGADKKVTVDTADKKVVVESVGRGKAIETEYGNVMLTGGTFLFKEGSVSDEVKYFKVKPEDENSYTAIVEKKWKTELFLQGLDQQMRVKVVTQNDDIATEKDKENVLRKVQKIDLGYIDVPKGFVLGEPLKISFGSDLGQNFYDFGVFDFLSWGLDAEGEDSQYLSQPEPRPNLKRTFTYTLSPVIVKKRVHYVPTVTEGSTAEWSANKKSWLTYCSSFEKQPSWDLVHPRKFFTSSVRTAAGYEFFLGYSLGKASRFWKCTPLAIPELSVSDAGASELSNLKSEHVILAQDLEKILDKEPPAPKKGTSAEDSKKQLAEFQTKIDQEILGKDKEMRGVEKEYFEALSRMYGAVSESSLLLLREALRNEAICLAKARTEALDEMRAKSFRFVSDSDYFRFRKYYEAYFKDLQQVLNIWNNLNRMELLRLDMLLSEHLKARAVKDAEYNDAALLALQKQIRDVYADEAWIYLVRGQAIAEDTLDGRDSYGAALVEARKRNLKQPWHNEFLKRQSQRAIYGTQYLMGTFGTMWTGFIDSLTQIVNAPAKLTTGKSIFNTLHDSTNKQLKEVRKKSAKRLAVVDRIYNLTPDECGFLGAWSRGDGGLPDGVDLKTAKDLDADRSFGEATNGGFMRFAACFETEKTPLLEWEYRIAHRHGKLCWEDMRKALYLREGRKETGEDPLLRRMIDPMGSVKTAAGQYIGKQYDGAEDYLAERNGQLMEMEGLLPLLKKIDFDLESAITQLPVTYQTHFNLSQNNPDYMTFMQKYRMVWGRQQEIALYTAYNKTEDALVREQIQFKLEILKQIPMADAQQDLIRILKQQLSDRIAVSDYEGALGIARQIEDVEPATKGLVSWLSQDLAWEQAKEVGINTSVSIGNQALYAAFFARYLSPAAVRNQPVNLSNVKAVFKTWNGFSGFLQFTWGQVNPFSNLTSGGITTGKEMAAALTKVSITGMEQVVQERIKQNVLIGYFGLDEKYADFLANIVINFEQLQREDPTSLVNVTARNLLRKIDAYVPDVVNLPGWQKVQDARLKMRDYWLAMDALVKLEALKQQLQDARKGKTLEWPKISEIGKKIGAAYLKIKLAVSPLNQESIRLALGEYDQKLSSAKTDMERVAVHAELFRTMPFAGIVAAKKAGELPKDLEAKIDVARREMLSTIQTKFLEIYPGMAPYIERYIYTGSGARETWPEYKKVTSDLDFTIVLREGVPLSIKNNIKETFDAFFAKTATFPPEEFDVHSFVDERPNLPSRGQTADQLLELVKDPAQAEKLSAETKKNIETLLADLGDAERYLSTGAIRFLQYLNKLGGKAKKVKDGKLEDDTAYQDELYKNVKFEPWMGLEIVLDNIKMIQAHAKGDRLDYATMMDKYGLRILLARIIQSDAGLKMVNDLTIADIEKNLETTGGIHGEFVRIAEALGERFTPEQKLLFKEMNLRKQGKSWGEVLAERNGGKVLANDDPAINSLIDKHMAESEGFIKDSIRETAVTHATEMKKLADAVGAATEPNAKEALLSKYREILYSTATVWNALPDDIRVNVIATSPGQSDVYRALEDVRTFVKQKDMNLVRNYNPFQRSGDVPKSDQPESKP